MMADMSEDWWREGTCGSEQEALRELERVVLRDLLEQLDLLHRYEMYSVHSVDGDMVVHVILTDGESLLVTLDQERGEFVLHNPVGLMQKVEHHRRRSSTGGRERSGKYSRRDERIREKARKMAAAKPQRYANPARLRRDLLADWPAEWGKPISDDRLSRILR